MVHETVVQGMAVDGARVAWLQSWIAERRDWSRKRLAQELCRCWEWRNSQGRLKDFAARSFLLKAELKGWIQLPALQENQRRVRAPVAEWSGWEEPPPRGGSGSCRFGDGGGGGVAGRLGVGLTRVDAIAPPNPRIIA